MKKLNLIGQTFGRLTVIERAGKDRHNKTLWLCRCACENRIEVRAGNLTSGHTLSCGCLQIEKATTHGMNQDISYQSWLGMKDRCSNSRSAKWSNYGGRQISVCDRWLHSFENFIEDMGPRPSKRYSLDRIDPNGNYTPENCRWATASEQANNKRSNHCLTYQGRTLTLAQWSAETGIAPNCVLKRIQRGWSIERALSTPSKLG